MFIFTSVIGLLTSMILDLLITICNIDCIIHVMFYLLNYLTILKGLSAM